MYYSFPCPSCGKMFYTFTDSRDQAAKSMYAGIKQHLTQYGEDDKEHTFDDPPAVETNEVYTALTETADKPTGGYEL